MTKSNSQTTQTNQTHVDNSELFTGLSKLEQKYDSLVWLARKPPTDHPWWQTLDPDIRHAGLNAVSRVLEMYPDEADALGCCEHGDFAHGWNSGRLALIRGILEALEVGWDNADFEENLDT